MIIDANLVLSDNQAITASAASTNVIDLGATGTPVGHAAALVADLGKLEDVCMIATVTETFATLTSLTVSLETSDDNATFREVASKTSLAAALTAGTQLKFPSEVIEGADGRYLRLNYTVNGADATAGKIFAAVVAARQTN
jgi:hypothetical protein